jgi:hypothetical protein
MTDGGAIVAAGMLIGPLILVWVALTNIAASLQQLVKSARKLTRSNDDPA